MFNRYPIAVAALALAVVSLTGTHPASAQSAPPARTADALGTVRGTGADYEVAFLDDPLAADGREGTVPRIFLRLPAKRTLLIRARASFVAEMLKTVEKM